VQPHTANSGSSDCTECVSATALLLCSGGKQLTCQGLYCLVCQIDLSQCVVFCVSNIKHIALQGHKGQQPQASCNSSHKSRSNKQRAGAAQASNSAAAGWCLLVLLSSCLGHRLPGLSGV
jgi:hypothetical protein